MRAPSKPPTSPVGGPFGKDMGPDRRLIEALICPVTHGRLTYDPIAQELISPRAGLAFPIRSGVPLMSVDVARELKDDETRPR